MKLTDEDTIPTGAVGKIIQTVAELDDIKVVGVDIGGATTDVFSVFKNYDTGEDIFNRSVSTNFGNELFFFKCNGRSWIRKCITMGSI